MRARPLLLLAALALGGCASAGLRPPQCSYSAPGLGRYELARVGQRADSVVTVYGLLTDVDSGAPVGPSANVASSLPTSPDSAVSGAAADSMGRLAFDVVPGVVVLEARALGYVQVRTDPVSLPPGTIWEAHFQMHKACPIVEDF